MPLADPTDPERMNLGEAPVPIARPVMFGDIFTDVHCSRGGELGTVMALTHPCSMRTGAKGQLRPIITVAAVVASPQPGWRADRWAAGSFDYLPIYDMPHSGDKSAVHLIDLHSAPSAELNAGKRIGALSDYGITVLLQRWMYQLSRAPIELPELADLIAPILAETEIQEHWCEAALAADPGGEPAAVINAASARVQEILGPPTAGTLRSGLSSRAERASVRRRIATQRKSELGS